MASQEQVASPLRTLDHDSDYGKLKMYRVAINMLLVGWALICAALIIYYSDYSLLIVILNMTALWLCGCIYRLCGFRSDSEAVVALASLYRGFMNGATLGLIVAILGGVGTGRYVPMSIAVACGIFIGIILAVLFPRVVSKCPSL